MYQKHCSPIVSEYKRFLPCTKFYETKIRDCDLPYNLFLSDVKQGQMSGRHWPRSAKYFYLYFSFTPEF